MKNLAVFASGSGTNLENLALKIKEKQLINCKIELVVSDQAEAFALKRAKKYYLKTAVIERPNFETKQEFEKTIMRELEKHKIDYIILAGFMRILSPEFIRAFPLRIINIHPALLPEFPGAHAIRDAWDAKAKTTGVSVHFVDEGIDTGPLIFQKKVGISHFGTFEDLEKRIHEVEYKLYPKAVQLLIDGQLSVVEGKVCSDGKPLTTLVQ